ncbi:MAG: hypothetical protein HQM12_12520 [SAR324 cluster bacterium]|nr:hypothetical protein [SAR324 cluster bacterium]
MAEKKAAGKIFIGQMLQMAQSLEMGDFSHVLQQEDGVVDESAGEVADIFNQHLQNLQFLGQYIPAIKTEISRLIDGIYDVLQTIEKASIRVLDNTDGILEQHDIIEQGIKQLKHNPAIARVIGKRLDNVQNAQNKSRMFVFDSIQAQEFQELTKKQTEMMVGSLQELQEKLNTLQSIFCLQGGEDAPHPEDNQTSAEDGDDSGNTIQDSVDQLLAEFGL